jgi:uncharacterized protein YbaR (Trm112 family)
MPVPKELLEVLACPKCKGDLDYDKKVNKLVCNKDRLRFKVIDDNIPDMLIEDAEKF